MNRPQMEMMESRLLLSAGVLAAGQTEVFDLDGNGVNDAVLMNLGVGDLAYEYADGSLGFDIIQAAADGAAFRTNTWVKSVGDVSEDDDFDLAKVLLGKRTKFEGVWYDSILGDSRVAAGSIGLLELGVAGSIEVVTSEGDLLKALLIDDAVVDVISAGNIGTFCGYGDLSGSIRAEGDISVLTADDLSGISIRADGALGKLKADRITDGSSVRVGTLGCLTANVINGGSEISVVGGAGQIKAGTMENMAITTGGDLNGLFAGTISGSAAGSSVTAGGHVTCLWAETITGGVNGMLNISVGAGLDNLCVGRLDGGWAVDGGFASMNLSVYGSLDNLCAGQISGGRADGAGSFAMLYLDVQNLPVDDVVLEAGDIGILRAMGISGGEATDSGEAMLFLNVANDLRDAGVGRIAGSGVIPSSADPSVFITAGHDIVKFTAGEITAGTAAGSGAYASVWITAGNDIQQFSAGRIDGGSAVGEYSTTEVRISAGRDIGVLNTGALSGGVAGAPGAITGVFVDAGRDIGALNAGVITGGRADGVDALARVNIRAANDIGKLCAGYISGGGSANGGASHANIVAEHDIVNFCAGTILGSENGRGGCDPAVQIQAYNDIRNFAAWQIVAGRDGLVNILAGIDGDGNLSGDDGLAGSIENMIVCTINGSGGVVNIASGGDIDYLKAWRIVSGDGEVNIIAGGDITADVWCVQGWIAGEESGVEFLAGGEVHDIRGSIREEFITEGEPVELPTPIEES